MHGIIFIGDELTASGFRLAGCEITTPDENQTLEIFETALSHHAVVIVSASHVKAIPPQRLDEAYRQQQPLVVVLPDIIGGAPAPELADKIRSILGV